MAKRLIINAVIVNENQQYRGSILIDGQIIEEIYRDGCPEIGEIGVDAENVIDAEGAYVIPGVIDDQVHFREPGNTHKGCIKTESRAALLGGVTSFMDMPNNNPPCCSDEGLQNKLAIAARDAYSNYAFYIGASNTNMEELQTINPDDYCGIKVFMGSSTGNMLVDSQEALEGIFSHARKVVATHCEEEGIIRENLAKAKEEFGKEIPFSWHPKIRSREACIESSRKALAMAVKYGTRLHILHLSTADEIEMIREARKSNPKIAGEICVHYLWFNDTMYDKFGSRMKCNPAIKRESDMLALREAVKDGTVKVIATDHAPHLPEEKANTYTLAPSGLPLVQHSLLLMLELSQQGVFPIETVVERMSHGPADLFSIKNRGYIRKGYYADLVFVKNKPSQPEPAYFCHWTPFEGMTFSHSIERVILNGKDAVIRGRILDEEMRGMKLEYR